MEKKDIKIGQKVYLKIIKGSNAARYIQESEKCNCESWIKEKIVTKIGKKYITVADDIGLSYGEEKFDLLNNFAHYYTVGSRDYILYFSKEEIVMDMECEKLYSEIKLAFSEWDNKGKYTLGQLQRIKEILESV